jgi:hypothetical protein
MSDKKKSKKSETPEKSEGKSTNHSGMRPIDKLFLESGIDFVVDDSRAGQSFVWPATHWPSKPEEPTLPPADDDENKI